ncbi:nudC domain-containing protein 1 isoform X2 [Procambarus clarkii]|uniref:nudC domain-containing protein 1 isoform X2 n=1 Tax=Procambarus clarkii TaxID=6728 RepID=UPI00374473CB
MAETISLKLDHKLLNPNFDGYKLFSDAGVTVYTQTLREGVGRRKSYSNCYLHTRLEALHNHLFGDPFHPLSVYYFNNRGHLVKCNYSEDSRLSTGEVVWQADLSKSCEDECEASIGLSGHYQASVHFPSSDVAVVNTGQGALHVLETGDRNITHSWLLSFECNAQNGVIAHASLLRGDDDKRFLHCLLVAVTTPNNLNNNPEYVVTDEKLENTKDSALHLIHWLTITNNENITVMMNVDTALKEEVKVEVTAKELNVHISDKQILQGHFQHPVKADLVTWTLVDGKLEVILTKVSAGVTWQKIFDSSDMDEEEIPDHQMVEDVNQKLAHLTSNKWNPSPDLEKSAYNAGQLEACDEASEDLLLVRLDGASHQLSNLGHLGPTQHLFNSQVHEVSLPAFCLRHDVDGILWQPSGVDTFTHVATFNAFGYVKASKTMAKFTCSSADASYVAVADVKSHIYVFFQPEAFGGELRNRKSGKRMNTVARQLVISLKTHSEILGLHASPGVLFVLTDETLYAYCIRNL